MTNKLLTMLSTYKTYKYELFQNMTVLSNLKKKYLNYTKTITEDNNLFVTILYKEYAFNKINEIVKSKLSAIDKIIAIENIYPEVKDDEDLINIVFETIVNEKIVDPKINQKKDNNIINHVVAVNNEEHVIDNENDIEYTNAIIESMKTYKNNIYNEHIEYNNAIIESKKIFEMIKQKEDNESPTVSFVFNKNFEQKDNENIIK